MNETETDPEPYPDGWWEEAFVRTATQSEKRGKPKGEPDMLIVVAYDITEPKRLKKVADCCKDFGIRVQYSIFECRLEADAFDLLWNRLCQIVDAEQDRIVAYPLHGSQQRLIRTHGTMVSNEQVVCYLF